MSGVCFWIPTVLTSFILDTQLLVYSGGSNTERVQDSDGRGLFGFRMVQFWNGF